MPLKGLLLWLGLWGWALAAKVRNPPMLLKNSMLQRGKPFASVDLSGLRGSDDDGHSKGRSAAVIRVRFGC